MNLANSLPKDILESDASPFLISEESGEYVKYLLSEEGIRHESVFRYVCFLKTIMERANAVAELYDLISPAVSSGDKKRLRHIGPKEIVHIAHYLYIMDSFGIPGDVLECGVYHGFSTCVLSHACSMLNRRLIAADSFCGLPSTRSDEPFFREGDYAASLDLVKKNIQYMGEPSVVDYIQGFFCDSLDGFDRPLAILWMDVDLYESAKDVMSFCGGCLTSKGVVFTHEFTNFYNQPYTDGDLFPPKAIRESFRQSADPIRSVHLMRYFGAYLKADSVQPDSHLWMNELYDALYLLDDRYRSFSELQNCKTVKTAFSIKNAVGFLSRGK